MKNEKRDFNQNINSKEWMTEDEFIRSQGKEKAIRRCRETALEQLKNYATELKKFFELYILQKEGFKLSGIIFDFLKSEDT